MSVVGLVYDDGGFCLPVTQTELADTTGMTTVHTNRTLQRLRKDQLIATAHGRLTILDAKGLAEVGGFNSAYLHTDGPSVEQKLRARQTQSM